MEIYLIRHGETTGDMEGRYGGTYDDHLTEIGKTQSRDLAHTLIGTDIQIIYTSPLLRARETASILQAQLKVPIEVVPTIRERNSYGILTGMHKEEAKAKYPLLVDLAKNPKNTIPGAEPYDEFKHRVLFILEELSKETHRTFAVVTHGGPMSLIFRELFKFEVKKIDDCAYAILTRKDNKLQLSRSHGIFLT